MSRDSLPTSSPACRRIISSLIVPMAILLALGGVAPWSAPAVQAQAARVPAPELDGAVGYLGTDKPIHLKDLRGKIVLLDFWTLC
jgi:hypothetical protein